MLRKGLPGRKEVGKRRMATAEAIGGVEEQWLAQKVKCNNNKSLFKRKSKGNTGEKQIFVV